jgi:excinuclease UvrABC helicase subunit UvrB
MKKKVETKNITIDYTVLSKKEIKQEIKKLEKKMIALIEDGNFQQAKELKIEWEKLKNINWK